MFKRKPAKPADRTVTLPSLYEVVMPHGAIAGSFASQAAAERLQAHIAKRFLVPTSVRQVAR